MVLRHGLRSGTASRLSALRISCSVTSHAVSDDAPAVLLLFACICTKIPAGRRSVLDAYGEVIMRGWRDAVGPCLAEIETSLIQVT